MQSRRGPRQMRQTRAARSAPPQVGGAAAAIFSQLAQKTRFMEPKLAADWPRIAGAEVAKLCRPGRINGGRRNASLELYAISSAAATRVQFEEERILRALNDYFGPGAIGRLVIRHRQGVEPPQQKRNDAEPSLSSALSRFRQSVSARADKK